MPRDKNPESRGFENPDGQKTGIFHSRFFRDFQIPIPISGI